MTEFDFFQRLEDGYSVEDVLDIIGLTPSELYKKYLYRLIMRHKEDFANV